MAQEQEQAMVKKEVDQSGQQQPPADEGQRPPEGGVVLSPEQYNALLDHVSTLEAKLMERPEGQSEVRKLDQLIDEAGGGQAPRGVPAPSGTAVEDMSPQQVLQQLYGAIQQNLIQPLETKIETLRIMNEIDKVSTKKGNEDFWDYAPMVKEIAIKNPTLSIQQAYNLAKTEGTRKPAGSGEGGLTKKSDLLYTLPKRPNVVGGEKPGASGSNLKGTAPLTRRDAASEAFDKATGGKV